MARRIPSLAGVVGWTASQLRPQPLESRQYRRATRQGMCLLFQDEQGGSFAQYQAAAVGAEGPAAVVGEQTHSVEPGKNDLGERIRSPG